MLWMLTAILICGAMVFSACSDNDDSSQKVMESDKHYHKHSIVNKILFRP